MSGVFFHIYIINGTVHDLILILVIVNIRFKDTVESQVIPNCLKLIKAYFSRKRGHGKRFSFLTWIFVFMIFSCIQNKMT